MKIVLLQIGKTDKEYLEKGISDYVKRIDRMLQFETLTIPDLKNRKSLSHKEQKKRESEAIITRITQGDHIILLDEKGKNLSSKEFAGFLDGLFQRTSKRIVFIIGGPYGFHSDLYKRSDSLLSLSRLTFSHQMVRLLIVEQIYRGLSILKGLPYHNE